MRCSEEIRKRIGKGRKFRPDAPDVAWLGSYYVRDLDAADALFTYGLPDGVEVHWAIDNHPRWVFSDGQAIGVARDVIVFTLACRKQSQPGEFSLPKVPILGIGDSQPGDDVRAWQEL